MKRPPGWPAGGDGLPRPSAGRRPEPRADYDEFEASELFCPHCRRATPVRKHLLIVLPQGNKYDYRCSVCGRAVGTKTDDDTSGFERILRGT